MKLARSRGEVLLYLDLTPCERCGAVEMDWETAVENGRGTVLCSYEGSCMSCGTVRRYLFRLPESGTVAPATGVVPFGGEQPSELLDAGEWLWVADLSVADLPESEPDARRDALDIAATAVDEVLKFLPAGANELPSSAFWTERGEAVFALDPSRFDQRRLIALRDKYRRDSAGLPAAPPDRPGGPAPTGPLEPEAARTALRDRLTAVASALYPETEPLAEVDPGPLEVEPGRYRSEIVVTTGTATSPWQPIPALIRVGAELAAHGWRVEGLHQDGDRYEAVSRRDGAEVTASMGDLDGILRLIGRTAPVSGPGGGGAPADVGSRWIPANEVEEAMLVALERGDRENLTGLLRAVPLYLPAPEYLDDLGVDEDVPLATVTVGGVVRLVAYTSPETLLAGVGELAESWAETSYRDLVARWPDPAWQLAINPGTPAEVHLPVETDE
jgi:hypothetical protein